MTSTEENRPKAAIELQLEHDWYNGELPPGLIVGEHAYIETSFSFAMCASEQPKSVVLAEASGLYNQASVVLGPHGRVEIGRYSFLNGTYLICSEQITIGDYVMLGWGAVIADSWLEMRAPQPIEARRRIMKAVSESSDRLFPMGPFSHPVTIEDNVWVGCDAVILPGVRLGRGCIIAAKAIVTKDVEAYTIVGGSPLREIGKVPKDDDAAAEQRAVDLCRRQ